MSSQTVYFTNPAIITDLQTSVKQSFMTTVYTGTQTVKYSGNDLNNSGYMPKNNEYLDKFGVASYQVSKVTPVTGIPNGISKTLNGVCDENYIYYAWEAEHNDEANAQGQDLSLLLALGLGPNSWVNGVGPTYLLKVDRKTNDIVLSKHLGDITGFKTTNFTDYNQAGDDVTRGPLCIYDGHIYLTGQGQKYHTIMKIRCSDLTLVWREQVWTDSENVSPVPGLSQGPAKMRNIIVVPPITGAVGIRSKPMVVSLCTSTEYGTVVFNSITKLFGFLKAYGHVFAYTDNGPTVTKAWQFDTVPEFLETNDLLPQASFNLTSTGSVQDELRIHDKLVQGYTFNAGSSAGTGSEKTDGVFYFLNKQYVTYTSTGAVVSLTGGSALEYIKVDLTTSSYNHTQCGGVFSTGASFVYQRCEVQYGKEISLTGSIVANGQGVTGTVSGNTLLGLPVTKIFYKQQIGNKYLTEQEADSLNYYGAGLYNNITWDPVKDCVFVGSNNFSRSVLDDEYRTYNYLRRTCPTGGDLTINVPNADGLTYLKAERGVTPAGPFVGTSVAGAYQGKDDDNVIVDNGEYQNNRLAYIEKQRRMILDFDAIVSGQADFKYGPRAMRALNGSVTALGVATGAPQFIFKTWITDQTEHSSTFLGYQSNAIVYRTNGINQDMMPGTQIVTITPYTGDNGASNSKRYLVVGSKSRMQLLDLDAAYTGAALTAVSGESGNQFVKGIASGVITMNDSRVIYKDTQRGMNVQANFNSLAYNPDTKILCQRGHQVTDQAQMFGSTGGFQFKNYHNDQTYNNAAFGGEIITKDKGLLAVPGIFASQLYFYDVQTLVDNYRRNAIPYYTPSTSINSWAWNFPQNLFIDAGFFGIFDGGDVQMYGDLTVAGSKEGTLWFIDTLSKRVVHRMNINGGSSITPLMVDGVMYGYGGNSKWSQSKTPDQEGANSTNAYMKNAKELFMITPYGL